MDIEKLIEQLSIRGLGNGTSLGYHSGLFDEAAAALSAQQDENAQLRAELEYEQEHANAYHEECEQWEIENEKLRAELEQVKAERDVALEHLHGICSVCKNYSPYHNRGKFRYCAYEPARDKDAEANDNWEWRGPHKED